MSALGRHADASACGTCRKAVEAGETVVHEECAARAVLLSAPDYPDYEDLVDLTDDERQALPARFHTPQFDSLGKPNAWLCRVCWGDGWVTQWPCKAAQENGTQVFTHAFVDDSMTELSALRARVAKLETERHSTNEALSDAVEQLRVQRDRIAELEALTPARWQTCTACGSGYEYGEDCSNCVFQAHVAAAQLACPQEDLDDDGPSDCIAIPDDWRTRCQPEDPHDGPNHHDYTLGRDLPFIPQQVTGRCPKGHTFEDCTCGGGR